MCVQFINPFRPRAGHPPPYLAGREEEKKEFAKRLDQQTVFDNLVLTGLRGVGDLRGQESAEAARSAA